MRAELKLKFPFFLEKEPSDRFLEKGKELVVEILKGNVSLKSFGSISDLMVEAEKYLAGEKIVKAINHPFLINRFSILFSKHFAEIYDALEEEEKKEIEEQLGLKIERKEGKYIILLTDYLRIPSPGLQYEPYYLPIEKGKIILTKFMLTRLVEAMIKERIRKRVAEKVTLEISLEEIKKRLPRFKKGKGAFPPCISEIIKRIEQHENIPHMARWVVAVFLYRRGYSKEKILELFRNLPDFNEKISKYQIEYIFKKQYMMPSCSTMKSYNLCIAECGINNPLQFRGRKDGNNKKAV